MEAPTNMNIVQRCTQCDDNSKAVNYCTDCKEYICTECTNAHRRTKVTKDHKLKKMNLGQDAEENLNSAAELNPAFCWNESHANKEVILFCENCSQDICELCASEEHNVHVVRPLEIVFQEKHDHLATLVSEIKQSDLQILTQTLEGAMKEQEEKSANLKDVIVNQFQTYNNVIVERRNTLINKIEQTTKGLTKQLEIKRDDVQKGRGMVSEAHALLEETKPHTFLKSSHCMIEKLKEFQKKLPQMTDVNGLRYNQACTTEDFDKLVQALGSIQEFREETAFLSNEHNTQESTVETHSVPVESSQREQLMEMLKSLSMPQVDERSLPQLSYRPSKVDSRETQPGINTETFTLGSVNKTNDRDIPNPVSLVERNVPRGRRDILRSNFVQDIVNLRFQTWGVQGYWKVEDDQVQMFSRTLEEGEQCMQILKDTLLERTLELRRGSAFVVESDKWQMTTRNLKSKYPNQVEIEINHSDSKVVVYSTCTTILNDACDIVRIFLRDNQVKAITLCYDEQIATYVMKNKRKIQKIRNCFSQYCIEISRVDKEHIVLKGIGFGLGQVVRSIHGIALKYTKAKEEKRFDSYLEDDEDDDELRFSDDDDAKTEVNVQMSLDVDGDSKEAAIKALCFPGDDRMLYVVAGDMTDLPAEALVNAADKTLKHNGGLAKALVKKGGRSIQEECTDHVQRNGSVPEGQVFCSSAGTLPCSIIIHAVGPKWIDGKSNERDKLYQCVSSCMRNASRRRIVSLAFPAISAGTFKFPLRVATYTIVKAVKDFLQEQPRCSIRDIYFCDKAVDTVNEFANSSKDVFKDSSDIVFSTDMHIKHQPHPGAEEKRCDVRQLLLM